MNLVENTNQLQEVFNKYNVSKVDFKDKLTIVLPNNVETILQKYLSNVELSKQHKYVGSVDIRQFNLFNDLELYNILLEATHYANKIINESGMSILSNNTNVWKIFIYTNMMWELPFTLEDVIFIPYDKLNNCRQTIKNNYYDLIKTLIHEKIHVLQRQNPKEWIDYIHAKDKNWVLVSSPSPLFNFLNGYDFGKLIDYMVVKNPDTVYLDFKYVYKFRNNIYYGVMYLDKTNNMAIQWFLVTNKVNTQFDKENISFSVEKSDYQIQPEEHPFETFAYKISEDLTTEPVDPKDKLLRTDV